MNNTDRLLIGFVFMALCLMLPLGVFMRQERKSSAYIALSFVIFYVVWYLTLVIIHEGAHYVGIICPENSLQKFA